MSIKVIFLDIDGVLCIDKVLKMTPVPFALFSYHYQVAAEDDFKRCNEDCIKKLNQIIDITGAKIVVSSAWRLTCIWDENEMEEISNYLEREGVKGDIISMTPFHCVTKGDDGKIQRGDEIAEWLKETKHEVESFVIIDDQIDMRHLMPFLVNTHEDFGIQDEHVLEAVEILNKTNEYTNI